MIRSTKHSLKFMNNEKKVIYNNFLMEYRRVATIIGNSIWNDGYNDEFNKFNTNIDSGEFLNLPTYLDYNNFNIKTWLSARALCSLTNQISGMIRGAVKERKDRFYILNKLKDKNEPFDHIQKKLDETTISQPDFSYINPELSTKNVDIETGNFFDFFVGLKSIYNEDKKEQNKEEGNTTCGINIPIKAHKLDIKWGKRGKMLTSVLLTSYSINLRYEIKEELKEEGEIVGGDQGKNDILNLSDKQVTQKVDIHNHSLDSILDTLSKRKKGSKGFKKAVSQRKNFINWSINQLNFSDIKELKLEKIINITYKKHVCRKMSHWTNTIIRDKVMRKCEETKVLFTQVDSTYNSQQCPECCLVRKTNRDGKKFKCRGCGHEADADQNGAYNVKHRSEFPDLGCDFRNRKLNLGNGFYWKRNGVFTFEGEELEVPHATK